MKRILKITALCVLLSAFIAGSNDINAQTKKQRGKSQSAQTAKKSTSTAGPEWINGSWVFKGTTQGFFGPMRINAALNIDRANQRLALVNDNSVLASGRYEVRDGTIYCGDTYLKLDEKNHRIDFGNGCWMTKQN